MPARIHALTPETIGKIAAGEVVERPASVVKELLENAIDAGSRRIRIEIRGGGLESIEVTDDGHGLAEGDLATAVLRHATSKLTAFEDLDRLTTLGFRGEALPSIGAVSSLAIRSRHESSAVGCAISVSFGEIGCALPVAAPFGTSVAVRDLFANVPARRKFLRQPATESGYIARIVGAYAMAYPKIAVSLIADGRKAIGTDGGGDPVAAAVGVLGPELAGAILRLAPLDDSAAVPGVAVEGWAGGPSVTRSHRQAMVLFVNGRWIQNRAVAYALEEAYHSLLMIGRHPLAVVQVRLDPAAVDVNVHPTKAEVKFADERAVCRAVQRAAHAALAVGAQIDVPRLAFDPFTSSRQRGLDITSDRSKNGGGLVASQEEKTNSRSDGRIDAHSSGVPILRVLGQVAATYIIAEGPDGMYLVDQHAAHERVMYEKIISQLAGRSVDRQPLLDPLLLELATDELAAYDRSRTELEQIGFEIEPFGDGTVAVRAVPAWAGAVDIAARLRLILHELLEGGAGDSWLDSVAISAACHTAIRAGQSLSLPEMRELIADLERSSQPRACGHGRPTMLHLTQNELERQFARR